MTVERRRHNSDSSSHGSSASAAGIGESAQDWREVSQHSSHARALSERNDDLERCVALRTEQLTRLNEELRASEAHYRDVVETQTEFITRWRPDGVRTFVNGAYCRFIGQPARELIGRSFFPIVHPEDLHVVEEAIASLSLADPVTDYEQRVCLPNGTTRWTQWTTCAFFDAAGRSVECQSVGRDVTELKAASDMIRQKDAQSAHMSRLATMGEMVAGIAHEVAQPLHAAKTFAEAARRNLKSGRVESVQKAIECATEASHAIDRTAEIIHRLRDFTRPRSVRLEKLNLNDVVQEAAELLAYEIRQVDAQLKLELSAAIQSFVGDRIHLVQLCVNLVKNACEALDRSAPGKRELVVKTYAQDGRACVEVRDSGCGLDGADQTKLFDAFYSTKPDGMGMGLSLCKRIAEDHHGTIHFRANGDGPGVTFCFSLPVPPRD